MRTIRYLILGPALCLFAAAPSLAVGPSLLGFQGRLTDAGGVPVVGTDSVRFAIYDASVGGAMLWSETQSVTTNVDGFFSVLLGSVSPLSYSALYANTRYMGIKVESDPELVPRSRLASAAYSYLVHTVDGASGGNIQGALALSGQLEANGSSAVRGIAATNLGLSNTGVYGIGANSPYRNIGVYGDANDAGNTQNSAAVYGSAFSFGGTVWGGYFDGWTNVTTNFYAGAKFFRIDDPMDPANRTLQHACVESDEFKNVYDGVVTTDARGNATVTLPEWFEALNKDFRYQLTVIGRFAQVVVSQEIAGNKFTIASDKPDVKVSWQVTGVRNDRYAAAHPFQVQQAKPDGQRGKYLHPAEHGVDEKLGVDYETRQYSASLRKK